MDMFLHKLIKLLFILNEYKADKVSGVLIFFSYVILLYAMKLEANKIAIWEHQKPFLLPWQAFSSVIWEQEHL